MQAIIQNFFNVGIVLHVWPLLLKGLLLTAELVLVVVPVGAVVGLLVATLYSFHVRWLNAILIAYVDLLRAFPPLVLLILIYFGMPFLNVNLPAFMAAALALFLNGSSYYGEIFRAGIESIGAGQWEAARSTGLTRLQTLTWVILPQAIRNVIPPLATNTLELIKATSIASVVAFPELLRSARIAQGLVYNPTPLMVAALIYFILLWPLVRVLSRLERRLIN
ncbi:MAG TPA: amino acid ABC transporter permease [Trueperaceae bacterium]|nr:amino acid ABC transporter permease [Trueperaceae bacterium]